MTHLSSRFAWLGVGVAAVGLLSAMNAHAASLTVSTQHLTTASTLVNLTQPTVSGVVSGDTSTTKTPDVIEAGDTLTITFSQNLDPTSVCTTSPTPWTGSQITGPTATVTDGGGSTHDSMTFTATSSCASAHFGSVDLGDPGWLGGNKSTSFPTTVSLSGPTLTITFGTMVAGETVPKLNPTSSTAKLGYTPNGLILGTNGRAVNTTQFTQSTATTQF